MADDWDTIEVLGTEEEAELICGFLESQGIPCQVDSALSHEFPVNVSALGTVRVEVPVERLEDARRLLAEREGKHVLGEGEDNTETP